MRTLPLHLNIEECALMCNLLGTAMRATGKVFEDQPMQVKLLSTKLAKSYAMHESKVPEKPKTVFDNVKA
jgi:hypothetical protein